MFPSSDDRQDYYIFGGGDFSKNLHLTLESWEGAIYIYIIRECVGKSFMLQKPCAGNFARMIRDELVEICVEKTKVRTQW